MSIEQIVMTTAKALKTNDNYQSHVSKLESHILDLSDMDNLSEEQKMGLIAAQVNLEKMKALVLEHKKSIVTALEESGFKSKEIIEVATIMKSFL